MLGQQPGGRSPGGLAQQGQQVEVIPEQQDLQQAGEREIVPLPLAFMLSVMLGPLCPDQGRPC